MYVCMLVIISLGVLAVGRGVGREGVVKQMLATPCAYSLKTLGQQYNLGEIPTVIIYTYINRHARPSDTSNTKDNTVHN